MCVDVHQSQVQHIEAVRLKKKTLSDNIFGIESQMNILEGKFTFQTALPIIVPLSGGTNINPSINIIFGEMISFEDVDVTGPLKGYE